MLRHGIGEAQSRPTANWSSWFARSRLALNGPSGHQPFLLVIHLLLKGLHLAPGGTAFMREEGRRGDGRPRRGARIIGILKRELMQYFVRNVEIVGHVAIFRDRGRVSGRSPFQRWRVLGFSCKDQYKLIQASQALRMTNILGQIPARLLLLFNSAFQLLLGSNFGCCCSSCCCWRRVILFKTSRA